MDLIVAAGNVVTSALDEPIEAGAIAVSGGIIADVGPRERILAEHTADRLIDAPDTAAFPGLINTHTHLFQTFLRGIGEGKPNEDWIKTVTIPTLLAMDTEDMYHAALVGCIEAIRTGTTFVLDYMYPDPRHEMGDAVLQAMIDVGVGGLLGRGVADYADDEGLPISGWTSALVEPVDVALDDTRRLADECTRRGVSDRIQAGLAPVNVRSVTEPALTAMAEFASERGELITLHLNETPVCERVVRGRTGLEPAAWLDRAGFLGPNVLLVHCINISDDEIELIRSTGATVSYNPVSNMYMGNGVAPIPKLLEAGVPVGLATDGAASNNRQDMIEVVKAAVLLQRAAHRTGKVMSGRQAVDLATRGSADSLSRGDSLGTIEVGKRADIALFDFLSVASSVPSHDPVSTLAFSGRPSSTRWVIVGGEVVMEDGVLTRVDERASLAAVQRAASRVLTSVGAI